MKVAVLGASGMLGSMLVDYLSKRFRIVATTRNPEFVKMIPNVEWRRLDALSPNDSPVRDAIRGCRWAINAIGLIKQSIDEGNILESVYTNTVFPYRLADVAEQSSCCVIQIATDCVFSGSGSKYLEDDMHDAIDVYGKTKSLGETRSSNMHHLRCSIIGRELKTHLSLMDWFLGQLNGATVSGYENHFWNGVTTLHFARICEGIINNNMVLPHLQHIVPSDAVSKARLLRYLTREFRRDDIIINEVLAQPLVDRTLATSNRDLNYQLWQLAGYPEPPSISQMVRELAEYLKEK